MGIQSLQDFVDSSSSYACQLSKYLEETNVKTSNLLLIHADSVLRQFYHEHVDWVCGGQWSELFQCVEKFVRAFRQSDIELVVFFDGYLNDISLYQWTTKHRFIREVVRETLSHVIHNQNIPFRTKTKNFVPPGALKSALRLAFRACDVMVCSSVEDTYKEAILYGKDQNYLGIIGNDANFFIYRALRYISLGITRWQKKTLSACKIYDFDSVLEDLGVTEEQLPYFATLLGNFAITDSSLSSFYWNLIEEDNPLKRIQDNLASDAVLPPSETRLKCVAKFLTERGEEVQNIKHLAKIVFETSASLTIEEGEERLRRVIEFYQDCLKASKSAACFEKGDENQFSIAGFPLPGAMADSSNRKNQYKENWHHFDKVKQVSAPSSTQLVETEADDVIKDKLEDPEQVLKQGTLEEAAQALEQLELKESAAAEGHTNASVKEEEQEKAGAKIEEEGYVVIEDEEKPSLFKEDENCYDFDNSNDKNKLKYSRELTVKPVVPDINEEILKIARKRHQSGQMCPEILNLLTKGEIVLDMTIDDEMATTRLPIPLIYRPMRQLLYGVIFGVKQEKEFKKETLEMEEKVIENGFAKEEGNEDEERNREKEEPEKEEKNEEEQEETNEYAVDDTFTIKEWCIYEDRKLEKPDLIKAKGMSWGIPPLKKLWLGTDSEDNANRLKAFLSCMKSDTVNMSNTAMVPQRLMLLCCVLRYLVQQESGKSVLTKQDIDAFLAQALSTQLTTEHNTQNLANMKLNQVDARCVQLAAIFMSGIENAITANDACGSPVPWEFCCPWNFFDGKLFHSKWLQATMNFNATDLCEGKPHLAEKLERLRWCITEGLETKYTITGLQENKKFFNPFGNPPIMQSGPLYGVMRPAGSFPPSINLRRSRGPGSRRPVHGSGGTLHVAGVPVAHWGGNKAGLGYSKNAPNVLVGGPNSVDLPSNHRRGIRGGRGSRMNRGRGLLETPFISPWQQGFGFEDYVNSTYQRYMKGVQKAEQVRTKLGKMNHSPQVYSSRTRHQRYQKNTHNAVSNDRNNMWLGRGRGQDPGAIGTSASVVPSNEQGLSSTDMAPNNGPGFSSVDIVPSNEQAFVGRGQWLTSSE